MLEKDGDLAEIQKIYDSEINFGFECFWDADFRVWLGDKANGILAEDNLLTLPEIVPWLKKIILEHLPGSAYAKTLRTR